MKSSLEKAGYQFNTDLGIWIIHEYEGIAYSDGDEVEQRIARAVKSVADVSVLSAELKKHCIDWPSIYHLSSKRSNLMRPFQHFLQSADVLEIGAGCGAITRYLGESGANVLALEGSPRRAAIARSRTRDLENVDVVSETFGNFKCDRKFDFITLIGVLEYASMFTSGDQPHLQMLKRAKQFLKPGGRLILAIENQLGLKYFAGAPEDHIGQPMYGLENRYRSNQPQTFGRESLQNLLKAAGWSFTKFWAPYPDYKLPVSIITEEGFANTQFDESALASQSVKFDLQMPSLSNFSLELAYPEIIRNKLGLDMANSFLVVAATRKFSRNDTATLAFHYSTDRIPDYCKQTQFVQSDCGKINVEYRKLGKSSTKNKQKLIEFNVPESSDYIPGHLYSQEFTQLVKNDGWKYEELATYVRYYINILKSFGAFSNPEVSEITAKTKVRGQFIDLIPQNIIIRSDGKPEVIDQEWRIIREIELGYLLFRSFITLINMITRFGRPEEFKGDITRRNFVDHVLERAGIYLEDADYKRYIDLESEIQHLVNGLPKASFEDWGSDNLLPLHNLEQGMKERDSQIISLEQGTKENEDQIVSLEQGMKERHGQIVSLQQGMKESEDQIVSLEQGMKERHGQNVSLQQGMKERDSQIISLEQGMKERHGQIVSLQQGMKERDSQIISLEQGMKERDSQIISFEQGMKESEDQIVSLEQGMKERDSQIVSLQQGMKERDSQIVSLQQGMKERDSQVVSLEQGMKERDSQIVSLQQGMKERDSQVVSLEQGMKERDSQIVSLVQGMKDRDSQIVSLEQGMKERDSQIVSLEQGMKDRDSQVVSLEQGMKERHGQIVSLQQGMKERDSQIVSLQKGMKERDSQVVSLEQGMKERDSQIVKTLSSNSWKITHPLRTVRRNCITKPLLIIRECNSKIARFFWTKLPLKVEHKILVKNQIFTRFPTLFSWSQVYNEWRAFEQKQVLGITQCDNSPDISVQEKSDLGSKESVQYFKFEPIENPPARIIAFYLPQFHPIPENNTWWGEGFTEWTNVKPAKPQFSDHYQPRIPSEIGYYDLRESSVQRQQIELAKNYGIGGFCFYFYWFKGKRLLETPILNYLNDATLDLPFCLCWANENWSRRWDGLDSEMLITQEHSTRDDLEFIEYVSRYLKDPRYIKIDGKPLLLIYRPSLLPNAKDTAKRWRAWCREHGIGEIYLIYTQSFESVNPKTYGFDAAVEFPPNNSAPPNVTDLTEGLNQDFAGTVYDWKIFLKRSEKYKRPSYKLFRGVNPGWDNTARRKNKGTIFVNNSPAGYQTWLTRAINDTIFNFANTDERIVFVNAWNEWAEGAYLEPDHKFGYAYLTATRNAIECVSMPETGKGHPSDILAVVIHCFYPDVFSELLGKLTKLPLKIKIKIYVTTTIKYEEIVKNLLDGCGFDYQILVVENKGRDIFPFLQILPLVIKFGHEVILKLHTKKSKHRGDGDVWRDDLYNKLLNPIDVNKLVNEFKINQDLGMIGPSGHIVSMETYWGQNQNTVLSLAESMGVSVSSVLSQPFVAGSMFLVRVSSLRPLLNLGLKGKNFEQEAGQVDGTLAHAIERVFSICLLAVNKQLLTTDLVDATDATLKEEYEFTSKK